MEQTDIMMLVIFSVLAVIGLLIVALQKKGVIYSRIIQTSHSFDFVSGGKITFLMVLLGAAIFCKYSILLTVLYVIVFAGIYALIKLV